MNADQFLSMALKFKWTIRLSVVLAVGVGLGLLLGLVGARKLGTQPPKSESVISALIQPVPVPQETRLVREWHHGHGGGDGTVTWGTSLVLDITDLDQQQVESIPEFYKSYFSGRIPGLATKRGWQYVREDYGIAKAYDGTYMGSWGTAWTWRRRARTIGENLFCEIYSEVSDFDVDQGKSIDGYVWYVRKPVRDLNKPAQGQRVMHVRLYFVGNGLPGEVAWPDSSTWPRR